MSEESRADSQPGAVPEPPADDAVRSDAGEGTPLASASEAAAVRRGGGEEAPPAGTTGESITFDGMDIPIVRAGMPDLFLALRPPDAAPYIMAPREAQPQQIIDFFAAHGAALEGLRDDMLKRYRKSPGRKCRYQTGDVAYVLGRPFQLRVYPLAKSKGAMKQGARMRTTSKFSLDPDISLLTLYVVHPGNYDEGKLAFNGYAENVLLGNARKLAGDFAAILTPGRAAPPVRMRAMRGRWSSGEAGALWLSTDLIPYPPDCLVYTLWRELEKGSDLPEAERQAHLERILPGWREAARLLADRPEPYSLQ